MSKVDALGKIFGSPQRVKLMRLFLFNPEQTYDVEDLSKKTKVSKTIVRKELNNLEKSGLIKKRSFFKKVEVGRGKKKKTKNKRVSGFGLDKNFHYLSALQNLLIKIPPYTNSELEKKFKGTGAVKLLLVSGIFLQEWDSVVDVLVVGERLNNASVDGVIRGLEAEVGRELTYAVFDTSEFEYRINIYDKLVRDILDFPHEKIVNRLGL